MYFFYLFLAIEFLRYRLELVSGIDLHTNPENTCVFFWNRSFN